MARNRGGAIITIVALVLILCGLTSFATMVVGASTRRTFRTADAGLRLRDAARSAIVEARQIFQKKLRTPGTSQQSLRPPFASPETVLDSIETVATREAFGKRDGINVGPVEVRLSSAQVKGGRAHGILSLSVTVSDSNNHSLEREEWISFQLTRTGFEGRGVSLLPGSLLRWEG